MNDSSGAGSPPSLPPFQRSGVSRVPADHSDHVNDELVTLPEHYAWSSTHPDSPLNMFEEERYR
jgi:hypothetical protein